MVTQDEWAEKFKKVLSANPNATRKEIVDSVLASFPAHDRPAEPSVGERLTFFAEATIGGDGMKRYVMKATPGRGPPGKVALVTPIQAQQPTTAHAVEAVVAPSEEAHPTLPPIERQPGMAVLPTHPEEVKSAVAYKGPSEMFRGTVWFRRYIEEAQLSKSTDPWQVNFPDGSFWQFEVPLPAARSDYKPRKMPGGLTDLEVIQELLMKPGNAMLMIGHSGTGKCRLGSDRINVRQGTRTLEQLWEQVSNIEPDADGEWGTLQPPVDVQTWDGHVSSLTSVTRMWRQKVNEQIYKVILADGSVSETTGAHKYFTPDGWKRADELKQGELVAVSAKSLFEPTANVPRAVAELMAWQIAEGCESSKTFTNKNSDVLARVRSLAASLGFTLPNGSVDKRSSCTSISMRRLYTIFDSYGYVRGGVSKDKQIPDTIMRAPLDVQRAFLAAYFEAEGCISKAPRTIIEISTASPRIATSINEMLRRFGIWARVHEKHIKLPGWTVARTYYRVMFGSLSVQRFYDEMGPYLVTHKKRGIEEALKVCRNTNVEGTPTQMVLERVRDRTGFGVWHLGVHVGLNKHAHNSGIGRDRTLLYATKLEEHGFAEEAELMKVYASESIHWANIESIKSYQYSGYVYDIEVPVTHNYVANGIISHNTASAAAAAGDPAWDFNKTAGKNPWDKPRIYRAVMSNMSYEQLIGQFVPNKRAGQKAVGPDGKEYTEPQFKWMDGVLTRMVRYGGIFIADEINATQPDVLIAVNSLLDKDRYVTLAQNEGEVLHAHPQFRFIAAMNPQGYGYVGVKPLNDALKSRFSYTFWFDWDEDVEREIFKNVDEIIQGVKMSSVHEMFNKLRDTFRNNFLHYPPGTRDKEHFVGNVMTFKNVEHAIISLLMLYGDPKERKRAWAIIQPIFGDKAKKLSAADGERLFS